MGPRNNGLQRSGGSVPARPQDRSGGALEKSAAVSRKEKLARLIRKEAALARALETETGLRKIAANMANPVRQRLDYKGIFRKFCVVEQMPDGIPLIFDRDLPMVAAVKVGANGTSRITEMTGSRTELEGYETAARVKIPYNELYVRRYRALDRAKDRLIEGMELREDLIGFALLDAAFAVGSAAPVVTNGLIPTVLQSTAGPLDRDPLAKLFTQIEKNRLVVSAILMSPFGTQGLRRLDFQNLDQAGMQEIRETGFLGNMWGSDFFVSDQIPAGKVYAMASPKFAAWMPIRKDLDVLPADDPDHLRLGMVAYQNNGLVWHNVFGVAILTFNAAA